MTQSIPQVNVGFVQGGPSLRLCAGMTRDRVRVIGRPPGPTRHHRPVDHRSTHPVHKEGSVPVGESSLLYFPGSGRDGATLNPNP